MSESSGSSSEEEKSVSMEEEEEVESSSESEVEASNDSRVMPFLDCFWALAATVGHIRAGLRRIC